MLRINREQSRFTPVAKSTLADASILERNGLQKLIVNTPTEFFGEIGEELFLLDEEVAPSDIVADRIDLLCVDRDGVIVVVELKRGANKLQMMQAISYTGMIADWEHHELTDNMSEEQVQALTSFLAVDLDELNSEQRVLLIAEGFDYSLLKAAEWLGESYGVPIKCCSVRLSTDEQAGTEYLSVENTYPHHDLSQHAAPRRRRQPGRTGGANGKATRPTEWPAVLNWIETPVVRSFFEERLAAGWDNRPEKGDLRVRYDGQYRFKAVAAKGWARGVQLGRFDGDLEHWREGLSDDSSVHEFSAGRRVVFRLTSRADFDFFDSSVNERLRSVEWKRRLDHSADASDDHESRGTT